MLGKLPPLAIGGSHSGLRAVNTNGITASDVSKEGSHVVALISHGRRREFVSGVSLQLPTLALAHTCKIN
jgi:hypothetical protein